MKLGLQYLVDDLSFVTVDGRISTADFKHQHGGCEFDRALRGGPGVDLRNDIHFKELFEGTEHGFLCC